MTMPLPYEEETPQLDYGHLYIALNDAALVIKPGISKNSHRLTRRAADHRRDGFQIVYHIMCPQHRQREASIKIACRDDLAAGEEYLYPTALVIRTIMDQMRAAAATTPDPRAHDFRLRQLETRLSAMHERYITLLVMGD